MPAPSLPKKKNQISITFVVLSANAFNIRAVQYMYSSFGKELTLYSIDTHFKGGYLDFYISPKLKNIYITETYLKKEYRSSVIKNHKITNKIFFDGVS